MDATKAEFLRVWGPDGYAQESIGPEVQALLTPYINHEHTVLEIGPGRGTWTRLLSTLFGKVVTLDVLPKSDWLQQLPNVEHHELPDRCFRCEGVEDNSIDFVWSFGVFCHFTEAACRAYLTSIYQKMKSGASAILLFGNWARHPHPPADGLCQWFFQDLALVQTWLRDAGFVDFRDLLPQYRDTMAYVRKA